MLGAFLDEHSLLSLMEGTAGCPFPSADDRKAWSALADKDRNDLLDMAARYRAIPYPMVKATQFMAFVRSGSRKAFEDPYFLRRKKLIAAFMACCVTGTDDDLDDVIDGIWCICEETSWVLSAHNGSSHEGMRPAAERPLPDVQNPYVDLFCAQTGMILSLVCTMLATKLDAVTPILRRRVQQEIERRILVPFATRDDYWWMGFIRKDLNNWTPWIVSDVMLSATLWIADKRRLAELLERGCRMLDRWIAVMPQDGGCDEGAGYWNMAGGALLDCLETLESVTGGRMAFWQDEKLRGIVSYPAKAQLKNGWFVNFADCDARPYISGERLQYAGERLDDAQLTRVGAALRREPSFQINDTPQLRRLLSELFHAAAEGSADAAPQSKDVWLPDLQVRVLEKGRSILVAHGGHNGEQHNHNDVGSFMLYMDGEPAVVDAGNMIYTAKTFSDQRYELWNIRSRNHNVPIIGGCEQLPGTQYCAEDVVCTPDGMVMSMDKAYGSQAGVNECCRSLSLDAEGTLTLTDEIRTCAAKEVCWVFMLRHQPVIEGNSVTTGTVCMACPAGMTVQAEEIVIEDARMARNYPGSLWRLTCVGKPAAEHHAVFTFRRK